jgi:two-component system nitrate/nitrite response regulator NarL
LLRSTVYACESYPIVLEGLEQVLLRSGDLQLAGASATLQAALPACIREEPDLVLVDPSFPLPVALEFISAVRARTVRSQFLLWVQDLDEAEYIRALQAGVRGILRRNANPGVIVECLRAVAGGTLWVDPSVSDRVMGYLNRRSGPRLTPREREIAQLVCQGLKNKQISAVLGITPGTVKVHLMHIFEKTGVRDRFELAMQSSRIFASDGMAEVAGKSSPADDPSADSLAANSVGADASALEALRPIQVPDPLVQAVLRSDSRPPMIGHPDFASVCPVGGDRSKVRVSDEASLEGGLACRSILVCGSALVRGQRKLPAVPCRRLRLVPTQSALRLLRAGGRRRGPERLRVVPRTGVRSCAEASQVEHQSVLDLGSGGHARFLLSLSLEDAFAGQYTTVTAHAPGCGVRELPQYPQSKDASLPVGGRTAGTVLRMPPERPGAV